MEKVVSHIAKTAGVVVLCWASFAPTARAYRLAGSAPEFGGQLHVADADARIVVRLHSRTPAGVSVSELDEAIRSAVRAWNDVPCSRLEFVYEGITEIAATSGDDVTTIQTVDSGWLAMGNSRDAPAATLSTYANSGGLWVITDGDIYLNNETLEWMRVGVDPTTVVMHELGHRLGLAHPCGEEGLVNCEPATPLMSPIYDEVFTAPRADDVAGACFLYATESCGTTSCDADQLCVDGACIDSCDGVICAANELCEIGRCVRDCSGGRCEQRCTTNVECPSGARCDGNLCVPSTGMLGDPCASVHDCAAGECNVGYCSERCAMTCSYGYACTSAGMVCEATLGVFGARCTGGAECASGRCYQSTRGAALCTRLCGPGTACPTGFECAEVDDRSVCRPPPRSGCSASVGTSHAPWSALLASLVFVLARRARRS